MSSWILGGVTGLIGLLGLFLSSRAVDATFYYGGLVAFGVTILILFIMIKTAYDEEESKHHH